MMINRIFSTSSEIFSLFKQKKTKSGRDGVELK